MVFHESLNRERKFSLVTPLVFVAILAGVTGVVEIAGSLSPDASFASASRSQLAQASTPTGGSAPADANEGICGKEYTKCMDPAKKNDPERCDLQWRSCIKGRCVKTDTKTADSCLKDPDCVDACTELTAKNGDLINCCADIKRGNDCKTKILTEPPQCNPEKTKLPGGGSGTGSGEPTLEERQAAIQATKELTNQMENEKLTGDLWSTGDEEKLNQLKQDLVRQESAYEQILKNGGEPISPGDYQGENPGAIDKALGENAVNLMPGSPEDLAKAYGYDPETVGKEIPATQTFANDPYGDTQMGEAYSKENLQKQLDAVNAQLNGPGLQTMSDEKYNSLLDERKQLQDGIDRANVWENSGNLYESGLKPDALDKSVVDQVNTDWPKDANFETAGSGTAVASIEQQLDSCAYGGCSDELVNELRDARVQELENAKASANAGSGDFTAEQQKELNDLKGQSEPTVAGTPTPKTGALDKSIVEQVNNDWPKDANYETARADTPTPKKDEGIVPGTDQPGLDCSKGGCVDAKGNPIPPTKSAKDEGIVPGTDQPGLDCSKGGCVDAKGNPIPPTASAPKTKPEVKRGDGTPDAKPEVKTPTAPSGPGAGPGTGGEKPAGGGGGNPMGAIGSLLEGLMKALTAPKPPSPAPAQACSTDPNAFAQQQQQYQQQLQQYNYQLQQQQYQKQLGQYYADRNGTAPPPDLPFPQQPTACTPSTGNQCRDQVPQPNPNNCTVGYWQATYSGACVTGWQCIPRTGTTTAPVATLSCEPEVADVGQPIAITYGCSSGVATSSSFTVTTQPGGSATATVANPPAGTNTATYSLACVDQGKTSGAQCSVQVSRSTIILVANPSTVTASSTSATSSVSLISWLTTGMDSCVISSPDMPGFTLQNMSNTSVNGAATTPPLTAAARVHLECATIAGGTRGATTTVHVRGVPDDFTGDLIEASSTIDRMTVPLGATTTIKWRTINAPLGSAMSLWILDVQSGQPAGLIAGAKPVNGTYVWQIPNADDACPANTPYVCAADLISGREYLIEADLYTPPDADLGEPGTPSSAPDPLYLEFGFTNSFMMQ